MKIKIWSGTATFISESVIEATGARFIFNEVTQSDEFAYTLGTSEGGLACIRSLTDDTIEVATTPENAALVGKSFTLTVSRTIIQKCPTCERMGKVVELFAGLDESRNPVATHKHCEWSRAVMSASYPKRNSEQAIEFVRDQLMNTGGFKYTFDIRGKRQLTMHSTTFAENDLMREWEDELLRKNPSIADSAFFEAESRAHLALALDDDGEGKSPASVLSDADQELPSYARLLKMMGFFSQQNDAYYRLQLEFLSRLDSVVAEVCGEDPEDHYTEQQLLELAEDLVFGKEIVSEVRILGGYGFVAFRNTTTAEMDEAEQWAQEAIDTVRKLQDGQILKVRETELRSIAKLAMEFVGDHRQTFDTTRAGFIARMGYLNNLPLPMFHLYTRAGNVWRKRALKAGSAEMVGNF